MESQLRKILLIDDDNDIHQIINHYLSKHFHIESAFNLKEGQEKLLEDNDFCYVILDEVLPDGRGSEFCKSFLVKYKIPVISLTSQTSLEDRLNAFDSGVDDYLAKPFEPLELLARINAKLRSISEDSISSDFFEKEGLLFEIAAARLYFIDENGKIEIQLTPIEYKILYLLARKENDVFSRDDILENVWGENSYVVDRTVDQHVSKARKKISKTIYTIKSAHGKGYVFKRK